MPSIPFNALSESSSMPCTYPPTTKLSKQSTPVDESKPITRNRKKRSPLFNKRSSSPFLRLGHRCRHCGSLHSRACPNAKTFKNKGLPNRDFMNIMFGGTVATGKNAFCTSGQIPKETTEGSGDSADSTEFVDSQCEPFVNVDAMEVEGPSSSRAGPAVNKGKGLATSVLQFKPICKKLKKKRSVAQEMSDSLKSISNVIVERFSVSTRTLVASTATTQFKEILDMVMSLPGVHSGHHLHLFSTLYFMEKLEGRHMFAALGDDKNVQLKWLEMQYQRYPEFHFPSC